MSETQPKILQRTLSLLLCGAGALLCATQAGAAGGAAPSAAQAAHRHDSAACRQGRSNQDRATCLREADAALKEARGGRLGDDDPAQLERNRLRRCEAQPPGDREDCVRRMTGEGTTSGSVEGGGIIRELVIPVVPAKGN